MLEPVVRQAVAADVPVLQLLASRARAALTSARGGRRWLDTHPDPFRDAVMPGLTLVVALDADFASVAVGYLVLDLATPVARVAEVFVEPAAREVGCGDALIAAALDAARRADCCSFEAEALPGDRHTKNLYERAGITARLITASTDL